MITKKPRSKADHVKYHRILWQGIIDYIHENGLVDVDVVDIKHIVFKRLFVSSIAGYCFGCTYRCKYKKCCFNISEDCNGRANQCLNGLYGKFCTTVEEEINDAKAIHIAEKIRDFKVRRPSHEANRKHTQRSAGYVNWR